MVAELVVHASLVYTRIPTPAGLESTGNAPDAPVTLWVCGRSRRRAVSKTSSRNCLRSPRDTPRRRWERAVHNSLQRISR